MKRLLLIAFSAFAALVATASSLKADADYQYAARPLDFGDILLEIDEARDVNISVRNEGSVAMANIHYRLTIDGVESEEEKVNFSDRISTGSEATFVISLKGEKKVASKHLAIIVTRINGHDNEITDAVAEGRVVTTNGGLHRNLVVEEFTGAQCGFCPRGAAGMEVMREKYGNRFVGIAIHGFYPPDPMYILPSAGDYAYIFGGAAPSLQLNRAYGEIDPRRGTSTDILIDCETELAKPITAGVFLEASFNADSTAVEAKATIVGVEDGGPYTIEYVLVGDSIEGLGSDWWQANYYYTYEQGTVFPDMDKFCRGGDYGENPIRNWVYNDVALVSSYKNGINQTAAVGMVGKDESVENTFTLTVPTKNTLAPFIRKDLLWMMAILVDADGKVANGAKAHVLGIESEPDAITNNHLLRTVDANNYYDVSGRRHGDHPSSQGLFINNGKKVVVK